MKRSSTAGCTNQDKSLAERIRTLIRDQSVTIVSILTSFSMTISTNASQQLHQVTLEKVKALLLLSCPPQKIN